MSKEIQLKKRDRLPSKRSINLAGQGTKPMNYPLLIVGIAIIVVLAVLFSKFAVYDVLTKVSKEQRVVAENDQVISSLNDKINSYKEMNEEYEHYTYTNFTEEELANADRQDILKLLDTYVLPYAEVTSVSVYGNTVKVPMKVDTLQEANKIIQAIETDEKVDFCELSAAETGDNNDSSKTNGVTAQITIYMVSALEGGTAE